MWAHRIDSREKESVLRIAWSIPSGHVLTYMLFVKALRVLNLVG